MRPADRDMNRTQRLFALMDALRRHRRPVTAASLSDDLAVSMRTIYRDVQVLIGLGAHRLLTQAVRRQAHNVAAPICGASRPRSRP
jgi:predicted DNA-binding transcriptional regulator YafY